MLNKLIVSHLDWFALAPLLAAVTWIFYRWFNLLVLVEVENPELLFIGFGALLLAPPVVTLMIKFQPKNLVRGLTISALLPLTLTGSQLFLMLEERFFDDTLAILAAESGDLFYWSLMVVFLHCYYEMNSCLKNILGPDAAGEKSIAANLNIYHLAIANLAGFTLLVALAWRLVG